MKRSCLFSFIILFIFGSKLAMAQLEAGLLGGLNRASLSGDVPPNGNYHSLTGFAAGAFLEFDLVHEVRFSIQPMYIQRGTKIAYKVKDERDPRDSLEVKLAYLTLPLIFKVIAKNNVSYFISGIDIGIPVSGILRKTDNSGSSDILNTLTSVDAVINFGLGARFSVGQVKMFIEGRYTQGIFNLNSIKEEGAHGGTLHYVYRSKGLQVLTGIILPLSKK